MPAPKKAVPLVVKATAIEVRPSGTKPVPVATQGSAVKAVRNKRGPNKVLSIAEKKQLIHEAATSGLRKSVLAEKFGIGERTLRRLLNEKRDAILRSSNHKGKHYVAGDRSTKPILERNLLRWANKGHNSKVYLSLSISSLIAAATKLKMQLLLPNSGVSDKERTQLGEFTPTDDWAQRFVAKRSLDHCSFSKSPRVDGSDGGGGRSSGAGGGPEVEAAVKEVQSILDTVEPAQIYSIDEWGLLYDCLPRQEYVVTSDSPTTAIAATAAQVDISGKPGVAAAAVTASTSVSTTETVPANRVTCFVCTNADGSHKIPTTVVGKTKNPAAFQAANVGQPNNTSRFRGLPLPYYNQQKGWADKVVLRRWFQEVFLPEVRAQHPGKKVVLVVDSSTCDAPVRHELRSMYNDPLGLVKLAVLPADPAAKRVQPMAAGVYSWMRKQYKYRMLERMLEHVERWNELHAAAQSKPKDVRGISDGHLPNVLDALSILREVHDQLQPRRIANSWLKVRILPERHIKTLRTWTRSPASQTFSASRLDSGDVIDRLANLDVAENERSSLSDAIAIVTSNSRGQALDDWHDADDSPAVLRAEHLSLLDEIVGESDDANVSEATGMERQLNDVETATTALGTQVALVRANMGMPSTWEDCQDVLCTMLKPILLTCEMTSPDLMPKPFKRAIARTMSLVTKPPPGKRKATPTYSFLAKPNKRTDLKAEK